tara:strand:+ start:19022 stop:19894 length:873 start_codon:yes stop_codon:yes gene_type:complete
MTNNKHDDLFRKLGISPDFATDKGFNVDGFDMIEVDADATPADVAAKIKEATGFDVEINGDHGLKFGAVTINADGTFAIQDDTADDCYGTTAELRKMFTDVGMTEIDATQPDGKPVPKKPRPELPDTAGIPERAGGIGKDALSAGQLARIGKIAGAISDEWEEVARLGIQHDLKLAEKTGKLSHVESTVALLISIELLTARLLDHVAFMNAMTEICINKQKNGVKFNEFTFGSAEMREVYGAELDDCAERVACSADELADEKFESRLRRVNGFLKLSQNDAKQQPKKKGS